MYYREFFQRLQLINLQTQKCAYTIIQYGVDLLQLLDLQFGLACLKCINYATKICPTVFRLHIKKATHCVYNFSKAKTTILIILMMFLCLPETLKR